MVHKNKNAPRLEFAQDAFGENNPKLAGLLKALTLAARPRVFLAADVNVVTRTEGFGSRIGRYFQKYEIELAGKPVVLACGEKIKNDDFKSVSQIGRAALEAKIGRDDIFLAIGGGTLLDVAGYVAAQLRGGTRLVRLPTTPGAMMSSAFAESAALNTAVVKDAYRVPCAAAATFIDTNFATSVLDGVWRAGYAEAVRTAVTGDKTFFDFLVDNVQAFHDRDQATLEETVRSTIELKEAKGEGNFGLWAASRLESLSNYKLPYGYAVAMGILIDAAYAQVKGYLEKVEREALVGVLTRSGTLEGIVQSMPLLERAEEILCGLDAWRLARPDDTFSFPRSLGKSVAEKNIDRETMKVALNMVK